MRNAYRSLLDRLAFVIFGQRASDGSGDANNVAGNGGHGGGNQVPPYVPYSPYWDERHRRNRRRTTRDD